MLIQNVVIESSGLLRIGEVEVHILRLGDKKLRLGIVAPRTMLIVKSWDAPLQLSQVANGPFVTPLPNGL